MTTLSGRSRMTVRGAAALGVGAMVGAGIFALLGEAGAMAGSAVWASWAPFVLAAFALLLGMPVYRRQRARMTQPASVGPNQ